MTVGELVALLLSCDPRDTIICDACSEALLVLGKRGGMHPEWQDERPLLFTSDDVQFLSALRIHPGR